MADIAIAAVSIQGLGNISLIADDATGAITDIVLKREDAVKDVVGKLSVEGKSTTTFSATNTNTKSFAIRSFKLSAELTPEGTWAMPAGVQLGLRAI